MSKNFRLQSLTANSAFFADPDLLSHTLTEKVSNTAKKVGASSEFLNRFEMKEVIPRIFTDGTSSTKVDQIVGVNFSGYTTEGSLSDLTAAWGRMKINVDKAIADGALKGFRSDKVEFVALISA